MCTLLLAHRAHPDYPLVIAANRDELYDRPTAPAGFWPDAPAVLAGRDLRAGGTWLGVTTSGRWAAITNVREPARPGGDVESRGQLVADFLTGGDPPADYLARVAGRRHRYNGFNLVVGDGDEVWYLASRVARGAADAPAPPDPRPVEPGVHGLSNHLLDTPWPKVERGRMALTQILAATPRGGPLDTGALFEVLGESARFPDRDLPDTGVGLAVERALSPLFIATPLYGTCSSTVIAVSQDGRIEFEERTTNPRSADRPVVQERLRTQKYK